MRRILRVIRHSHLHTFTPNTSQFPAAAGDRLFCVCAVMVQVQSKRHIGPFSSLHCALTWDAGTAALVHSGQPLYSTMCTILYIWHGEAWQKLQAKITSSILQQMVRQGLNRPSRMRQQMG